LETKNAAIAAFFVFKEYSILKINSSWISRTTHLFKREKFLLPWG